MQKDFPLHPWLSPIAWLYALGVNLRNKLFDWGWLRSRSFCVPTICVGNLAVGGTGKTPHTEYLIRLLQAEGLEVATLSRGYKRKTKGYVLADNRSDARQIGDEPYQMHEKFPEVRVAVCEDRCRGIEELLKLRDPQVEVILLDDAFQHRYVKPGLSILLTDYSRLLCDDRLMPVGQLREPISGKNRARIVIVTKCPDDIKPIDFNIIAKRLHLYPYQELYFSRIGYGELKPIINEAKTEKVIMNEKEIMNEKGIMNEACRANRVADNISHVLLVTGIANPTPLKEEMSRRYAHVHLMSFGDHHDFSPHDIKEIAQRFDELPATAGRCIVTTEKDAARLKTHPALSEELKRQIFVIPITIEILQNQQESFNQQIIGYVRKNPRNS